VKIAALINAHHPDDLLKDTLYSILTWVTKDVLVVTDGAFRSEWPSEFYVPLVEGFYHNFRWGPYRNEMLGLISCSRMHNDADWYLYCEPDVLFASQGFKSDLQQAQKDGIWCLGFDHRDTKCELPFLEKIFGEKLGNTQYLIGCCVFYNGEFLRRLRDIGFLDNFLSMTNEFKHGFFPDCPEQDIIDVSEHLYPTIAKHWGGGVRGLTYWNQTLQTWTGPKILEYRVRWRPEIVIDEFSKEVCIFHPIKDINSSIRQIHQMYRLKVKKKDLCK
jgi:hypothetical protein